MNEHELDLAFEAVYIEALEAHTIDPKLRKELPDNCFALVIEDGDEKKRIYPLKVPGDKKKTEELISKAVGMFHYCRPEYKKKVAQAIINMIKKENISITISSKNKTLSFVNEKNLPDTVKIVNKEK